jgi:hypothetical protein
MVGGTGGCHKRLESQIICRLSSDSQTVQYHNLPRSLSKNGCGVIPRMCRICKPCVANSYREHPLIHWPGDYLACSFQEDGKSGEKKILRGQSLQGMSMNDKEEVVG